MNTSTRYVTDESGKRIAVLLDIEIYEAIKPQDQKSDLLLGLSEPELMALSQGKLSFAAQDRLDELVERNAQGDLSSTEEEELDHALAQIDTLNVLKARARYTLQHFETTLEE